MASKTGRPADENLPEVVQYQPVPHSDPVLPEVVPDSSPEAAQQRYFQESDKYPAYYDTTPKLLHEEQAAALPPGYQSPGQQYQQTWMAPPPEHSVSAISPNSSVPWQSFPPGADDQQTYVGSEPEPPREKRICGLKKRLFIIIAVIVGVVVVAAIGGGVGGAVASKSRSPDNSEADLAETTSTTSTSISATSTTPTTTSSTTTRASKTSSAAKETMTNLNTQADPDLYQQFAFQAWSGHNQTGNSTEILVEEGFFDFKFKANSYVWISKQWSCCLTFCSSKTTSVGWYCDSRKQNASEKSFNRLSIYCGHRDDKAKHKQCS